MKSNPSDPGRPEGLHYGVAIPDELAAAIDRARPRLGRLASTFQFFPTVGSTNDVALAWSATLREPQGRPELRRGTKALAERSASGLRSTSDPPSYGQARRSAEGAEAAAERSEGLVVVADAQTAGRGRRGHAWFSPPGSGLYVSVVLAPAAARADPQRATTLLTLTAGVALAEGIESAAGLRVDLKWPNDLQVSRRKLAGILAEASSVGAAPDTVVVGYGINVAATAFPPALRDRATSLESELGRVVDRHHLLVETLAALSRRYEDLLDGRFDAILDAWRRLAPAATGARVTWTTATGTETGVTAGIDDRGALLVRVGERVERVMSGEITWE